MVEEVRHIKDPERRMRTALWHIDKIAANLPSSTQGVHLDIQMDVICKLSQAAQCPSL